MVEYIHSSQIWLILLNVFLFHMALLVGDYTSSSRVARSIPGHEASPIGEKSIYKFCCQKTKKKSESQDLIKATIAKHTAMLVSIIITNLFCNL